MNPKYPIGTLLVSPMLRLGIIVGCCPIWSLLRYSVKWFDKDHPPVSYSSEDIDEMVEIYKNMVDE